MLGTLLYIGLVENLEVKCFPVWHRITDNFPRFLKKAFGHLRLTKLVLIFNFFHFNFHGKLSTIRSDKQFSFVIFIFHDY